MRTRQKGPHNRDGLLLHAWDGSERTEAFISRRAVCPPLPFKARGWVQILGRYRKPSHARSIIEIAITFGPLLALWALAWTALYLDYWWLAIPAAGFLVRLFMIQHDCGHGSFFAIVRQTTGWDG